jgi:cytochrome c oxidase subunit 2
MKVMYQQAAMLISIVLIVFIILVFGFVVLNSDRRQEYELIQKKAYRIRTGFFAAVITIMLLATVVTLRDLPFERPAHAEDRVVVQVVSRQFAFELSQDQFQVDQPIEFQVTSKDVNHGFGIYDEDLNLIAQTQAMPEYTNSIHYTFTEPGIYQILCMEYCGIAHHVMIKEIKIVSAQTEVEES